MPLNPNVYLLRNDEVLFFNISTKNWIRKGGSIAKQKHTSRCLTHVLHWVWVPGFSAMHWLGNLNIAELGYHCCCYKLKDSTGKSLLDVHLFAEHGGEHVLYKNCSEC